MTDPTRINPQQLHDALNYKPWPPIWSDGWYRNKGDLLARKPMPTKEVVFQAVHLFMWAQKREWLDMEWRVVEENGPGTLIRIDLCPDGYETGKMILNQRISQRQLQARDVIDLSGMLTRKMFHMVEAKKREAYWEEYGEPWDSAKFLQWLHDKEVGYSQTTKSWRRGEVRIVVDRYCPEDKHRLTWLNEEEFLGYPSQWEYFEITGRSLPEREIWRLECHPRVYLELRKLIWDMEVREQRQAEEAGYPWFGRYRHSAVFE